MNARFYCVHEKEDAPIIATIAHTKELSGKKYTEIKKQPLPTGFYVAVCEITEIKE